MRGRKCTEAAFHPHPNPLPSRERGKTGARGPNIVNTSLNKASQVTTDGRQVTEEADVIAEAVKCLEACRVTGEDFEERVLKTDRLLMVYFWARWCEPCLRMAPVAVSLARAYEGRLTLVAVDTDQDEDLARRQSVAGLPSTLLYLKGEVLRRFVGAVEEGLREAIDAALGDA